MRAILQMSLAASPLILCIYLARALLGTRVPAQAYLALWGLALCRLLTPVWLPMRGETFKPVLNHVYGGIFNITQQTVALVDDRLLFALWLLGFISCLSLELIDHFKHRHIWREALPIQNETARAWCAAHGGKRRVRVVRAQLAASPFTCGTLRPLIVLPGYMEKATPRRMEEVLTHEGAHVRWFHPLLRSLTLFAVCLHWFNPLAWLMLTMASRDMELACDAAVARRMGRGAALDFAKLLKKMEELEETPSVLSTVQSLSASSLQERYEALARPKERSWTLTAFIIALLLIIFSLVNLAPNSTHILEKRHTYSGEVADQYYQRLENMGYEMLKEKVI